MLLSPAFDWYDKSFKTYRSLSVLNGQHFETVRTILPIKELDQDCAPKNK